jgi:uncharacterized protein DUF4157
MRQKIPAPRPTHSDTSSPSTSVRCDPRTRRPSPEEAFADDCLLRTASFHDHFEQEARQAARQTSGFRFADVGVTFNKASESIARALTTPGDSVKPSTLAQLKLGHDFSRVRVHANASTERATRDCSAEAFTYGQHVFMRPHAYPPSLASHSATLAHELMHTIQQRHTPQPFIQFQGKYEGPTPPPGLQYNIGRSTGPALAPPPNLVSLRSAGAIASTVAGWFRDVTNAIRVQQELAKLQSQIAAIMPPKGGVLVGLVYQEDPLNVSFSTRLFMYAYVMAAGATPQQAYTTYKQQTGGVIISQAPFVGWQKVEQPFWIESP